MSKRHSDLDDFAKVEDFYGKSVYNESNEEERYQAFKTRLMRDLVAVKPNHVAIYVNGVEINALSLIERAPALPRL